MESNQRKDNLFYRHTQYSLISVIVFGVLLLVMFMLMLALGFSGWPLIVSILLLFCLATFSSLTTEVRDDRLILAFGIGLLRVTLPLRAIDNLRPLEIDPRSGLGINFMYNIWFYNVAGLKAVELDMRDGRVIRVGTDDPVELARGIENALIDLRRS